MRSLAIAAVLAACGGGSSSNNTQALTLQALGDPKVDGAKVSFDFNVKTGAGDPVPGLAFPANFEIVEDDKTLSASQATPSVGASATSFRALSLILVDVSKVVSTSDPDLAAVRDATKALATAIIGTSGGNHSVAVYAFAGAADPIRIIDFSNDAAMVGLTLDAQLSCTLNTKICIDNSTNLNGAIVASVTTLTNARNAAQTQGLLTAGALVVFTDGPDTANRVSETNALDAIQSSNNKSSVFLVGLATSDTDKPMLQRFGKDGFFNAADVPAVAQAFQSVATRVNGFASSYYRLQYCTAKRAGQHSLELRVSYTDTAKIEYAGSLAARFTAVDSITCNIQ